MPYDKGYENGFCAALKSVTKTMQEQLEKEKKS